MSSFISSLRSEWLKKKRSLASWMVIIGAMFVPVIIILARLIYSDQMLKIYESQKFWNKLWANSWQATAIFLLPLGSIMATSLVTQLEYKNNAWKQLHAAPIGYTTLFFSKLLVIAVMLLQFFILFNIAIYLSAIIPRLFVSGVPFPTAPFPFTYFLREDLLYFVDTLPIIGLQYLLSLHYKNFLVSFGAGIILWIGAVGAINWRFGYFIPYTYPMLHYVSSEMPSKGAAPPMNIHAMAVGYFVLFLIVGFVLYRTKSDKS